MFVCESRVILSVFFCLVFCVCFIFFILYLEVNKDFTDCKQCLFALVMSSHLWTHISKACFVALFQKLSFLVFSITTHKQYSQKYKHVHTCCSHIMLFGLNIVWFHLCHFISNWKKYKCQGMPEHLKDPKYTMVPWGLKSHTVVAKSDVRPRKNVIFTYSHFSQILLKMCYRFCEHSCAWNQIVWTNFFFFLPG